MKPHKLIEPWKGDKRFAEMAKRAAALKKAGQGAEAIVAAIAAEFGPPRKLERMRDARAWLAERDVLVEGLSVDEAPQAYKDIEQVMRVQVASGLVRPLARMRPVAVIMAGEAGDE